MADSDKLPEPPKEPSLTPNQQAIEDVSWDIPGFRTFLNLLYKEGRFVKNGWIAILVIISITVFFTWSCTRDAYKDKISDLKDDAETALKTSNQLKNKLSEKDGEIADARHDRDHYQDLLAPFEAMAISKYTNAPLEQRLELYSQTLSAVTNELESDRPIIHLEINGKKIIGYDSPKVGMFLPLTPFALDTNRQISMEIIDDSDVTAEHITINFLAATDTTNILADQWSLEPKNSSGQNNWQLAAIDSVGGMGAWFPQTVAISQGFSQPGLKAQITIHADRSRARAYSVMFTFQK